MSVEGEGLGSLLHEGEKAAEKGDWGGALTIYHQALIAALEGDDQAAIAEIHLAEGNAQRFLGMQREAAGAYLRALEIFRKLENRPRVGDALLGLGAVHWRMGDFAMAAEYLERCRALAADLGDLVREGRVLIEIGSLKLEQGDHPTAIAVYTKALVRLDGPEHLYDRGRISHNLGEAQLHNGNAEAASENFGQAIEVCRQLGDKPGEGWSLCARAESEAQLGKLPEAEADVQAARELIIGGENKIAVMQVMRSTAIVLAALGKRKEAEWAFADALQSTRTEGWKASEGMVLLERGRWRIAFSDYEGARSDLISARSVAEDVDGRWIRAEADRLLFAVEQHL